MNQSFEHLKLRQRLQSESDHYDQGWNRPLPASLQTVRQGRRSRRHLLLCPSRPFLCQHENLNMKTGSGESQMEHLLNQMLRLLLRQLQQIRPGDIRDY